MEAKLRCVFPHDPKVMTRSTLKGQPLATSEPKHKLVTELHRLCIELAGVPEDVKAGGGFFRRRNDHGPCAAALTRCRNQAKIFGETISYRPDHRNIRATMIELVAGCCRPSLRLVPASEMRQNGCNAQHDCAAAGRCCHPSDGHGRTRCRTGRGGPDRSLLHGRRQRGARGRRRTGVACRGGRAYADRRRMWCCIRSAPWASRLRI